MFCRQHYHLSHHHHHHRPHHQQIPRRNSTDVATSENLLKENFPEDHMNVFKSAALTTRPDSRMGVVGRNEIVALKIFWRILKHVVVIMPNGKTRMNSKMILKTGKSTAHQNILKLVFIWFTSRIAKNFLNYLFIDHRRERMRSTADARSSWKIRCEFQCGDCHTQQPCKVSFPCQSIKFIDFISAGSV